MSMILYAENPDNWLLCYPVTPNTFFFSPSFPPFPPLSLSITVSSFDCRISPSQPQAIAGWLFHLSVSTVEAVIRSRALLVSSWLPVTFALVFFFFLFWSVWGRLLTEGRISMRLRVQMNHISPEITKQVVWGNWVNFKWPLPKVVRMFQEFGSFILCKSQILNYLLNHLVALFFYSSPILLKSIWKTKIMCI